MKFGRHYMGVTAYVGLPGSGKTYSLAEVGVRALRRGRQVWANTDGSGVDPWFIGARPFASFDEFMQIPNDAVILWDELPLFVNARKWQEFPDGLLYRLTQIRKDGLELHFSTIDWRMVDVNVRRITFWTWECDHLVGPVHRRKLWPPEERRRRDEKPRRKEWFTIRPEVGQAYDTLGKVSAPLSLPTGAAEVVQLGEAAGTPRQRGAASSGGRARRPGARRAAASAVEVVE